MRIRESITDNEFLIFSANGEVLIESESELCNSPDFSSLGAYEASVGEGRAISRYSSSWSFFISFASGSPFPETIFLASRSFSSWKAQVRSLDKSPGQIIDEYDGPLPSEIKDDVTLKAGTEVAIPVEGFPKVDGPKCIEDENGDHFLAMVNNFDERMGLGRSFVDQYAKLVGDEFEQDGKTWRVICYVVDVVNWPGFFFVISQDVNSIA